MFVVLMYVPSSVTTGRRVCADASRPLRWGPPIERGRAVALCRYGCRRRGPPTPGPACRQRGGLLTAVPSVLAHPHPPALSVRRRAPFCWRRVRLFRPPCPTLIRAFVRCLSAGLSPPGSRRRVCRYRGAVGGSVGGSVATGELSAIRSFLPVRRAPPDQCSGVLRYSGGIVRSSAAAVPARSVLSFGLLSAAVGRRGFRSPHEASSCAARNRSKGFWACVELARSVVPVHPIDRCTCVASFTAGACARASRRLTPPLSDGGQRKIYVYLTAYQSDTFKTVFTVNLTFCRQSRPDSSICLRHGRRLAPPASFVYICHVSSQRPTVSVSETLGSFVYGYYFINCDRFRSKIGGCAHLSTHSRENDRLAACRDQ